MGKPSPTVLRTVDVMVPSWYGYWMLLSLQKSLSQMDLFGPNLEQP